MATKTFNISWLGVYKGNGNSYVGGDTIRVGSSSDYQSYVGIPSAVRTAIKTSTTTPTLKFKFNVTNANAEFDFGAHKETSNKASGTMPWYKYIGLHPVYNSTGWKTVDLTSAFMNDYKKGTYQGIVIYGAPSAGYGVAYGRNAGSNTAHFEVTGTWNTPPSNPVIKKPTSSTVAYDSVQVAWNASTDSQTPSNQLTYQLRYYNGTKISKTWTLGANVLSYSIPLTNEPETSSAYVEVRAYDGEDYSGWTRSAKFSVKKNKPPLKPTNLEPDGGKYVPYDEPLRLSWNYNGSNAQQAFKIIYRLMVDGVVSGYWDTGWITSSDSYYDIFGGLPQGQIQWWVTTRDDKGLESPESDMAVVTTVAPSATPTIYQPVAGEYTQNTLTVAWYSGAQNSYQLQVEVDNNIIFEEERFVSTKTRELPITLENEKEYIIRVRVADYTGLYSDWGEVAIQTNFTPPPQAELTLEVDSDGGSIILSWETPEEVAPEPPAIYTNVYRRPYNDSVEQPWELIGVNQRPSDSLIDYTPANNLVYQYKVVNYSELLTSSESEVIEGKVDFSHAFLHRASVPTDLILITSGDSREQTIDNHGKEMYFSNRRLPMFEFGISMTNNLTISWIIDTIEDFRLHLEFIQRKETFLYRDNNGRRFYCVLRNPKITDRAVNGFEISVELLEVDYQGGLV